MNLLMAPEFMNFKNFASVINLSLYSIFHELLETLLYVKAVFWLSGVLTYYYFHE